MATWESPVIVDDPRIDHDSPDVRAAAERLHGLESMDLHLDIADQVCVYCAFRASHVVGVLAGTPDEGPLERAVVEALMEVGGWDEIDGDGTPETIIVDHIRELPDRL